MINLKGDYKFEMEYGDVTFTDPDLEVIEDGIEIFPSKMMINASFRTVINGVTTHIRIPNIAVQNMNYEINSLEARLKTRLNDFKI